MRQHKLIMKIKRNVDKITLQSFNFQSIILYFHFVCNAVLYFFFKYLYPLQDVAQALYHCMSPYSLCFTVVWCYQGFGWDLRQTINAPNAHVYVSQTV